MKVSEKTQIVDELIANSNGLWKEKDRDMLMGFHGNKLIGIYEREVVANEVANALQQEGKRTRKSVNNAIGTLVKKLTDNEGGETDPKEKNKPQLAANEELVANVTADHLAIEGVKFERVMVGNTAMVKVIKPVASQDTTNNSQQPADLATWLKNAPPEVRAVVNNAVKTEKTAKEKLVGRITANSRNKFTKETLMTKDMEELEAIAELAGVNNEEDDEIQEYLGASAPTGNARFLTDRGLEEDDDDVEDAPRGKQTRNRAAKGVPLVPPTINWDEVRKEQKARTG